jgi:2-methylisocitrate lyase-like PEP mutase family enzyme
MKRSTQIELAQAFLAMHHQPELLVLPNAWDIVSAKLYEVEGFRAIGTTSAGIASTLGVPDGECMTLADNLAVCERIIDHVAIPVSVDIEAGYSACAQGLAATMERVIAAGAVGINIEDSARPGCGGAATQPLLAAAQQAERIAILRRTADEAGVPIVINARTDTCLHGHDVPLAARLRETIERGNLYHRAGANCVFVPDTGVLREPEIAALADGIEAPLNLIAGANTPTVERLRTLGVARLSFGPRPMRAALGFLRTMAREWLRSGTCSAMLAAEAPSYDEVNAWFDRG